MLRRNCSKLAVALVILGLWLSLPMQPGPGSPQFRPPNRSGVQRLPYRVSGVDPGRPKIQAQRFYRHQTRRQALRVAAADLRHGPAILYPFTKIGRPAGTFDPSNRANDNVNVPQAISLFYGGRIYGEHLGGLIQGTYDGVGNKFFLDNTDVRVTVRPELFGKPMILGLTLNNNPTVSDVSIPRRPGASRRASRRGDTVLTPTAAPQIKGPGQQVAGPGGIFIGTT